MKRKYLIIAMNMADLAAGIVFKRIVSAMNDYVDCSVFCPNIDSNLKQTIKEVPGLVFNRYNNKLDTWTFNTFGLRLSEYVWSLKAYKQLLPIAKEDKYDAVLTFVYGSNLAPLITGKKLSQKLGIPWAVYTVDAIPTPLTWIPNEKLYNNSLRVINKYVCYADGLFAANPKMLQYEIECLKDFKGFSNVVLTPGDGLNKLNTTGDKYDDIVFLYAGQVYNIRRIGKLLRGFEMFLEAETNAKLVFVGNSKKEDFEGFEHLFKVGKIERFGFTTDIESFYQKAQILIDINGDVDNDVFLSSKICNYLAYDKPIVAISRDGSPVRQMMSGYETIVHCHHNQNEICDALKKSISVIHHDFSERERIRDLFKPETVAKQLCADLEQMIGNRKEHN